MKIYLMRHGETLFNRQKRVQGWCDSPLTDNGISQAQKVGQYFEHVGLSFDAVYSSTQERARDTANLVAPDQEVVQLKGLKEMHFGVFEAQPEALLPQFRPGARSFEDLLVPYGGEAISEVGDRVLKTILKIAEKETEQGSENLLMVSHGAALWSLIVTLDLAFPEGIRFSNCNVCVYDYNQGCLDLLAVIDPLTGLEVDL